MKPGLKKVYLILMAVFALVYLVWRIGWTLPKGHGAVDMIFALILLFTELIGAAEMAVHYMLETGRKPCPPVPEAGKDVSWPDVDVLVTTCGEPAKLLEKTLKACLKMEYQGSVKIYLCDDAEREELKELTERLGVRYLARKEHSDAKAGNLNAALKVTASPLVAVFDADMCPEPGFLLSTVPYFLAGKNRHGQQISAKTGLVQTPQDFRNEDLFQRAFRAGDSIPNEQDYFYLELEPARNTYNSVIFGGSNALLSRKALKEAGGFATGTITEDFATGIEILKKGFRCIAIDTPLSSGLAPESLTAMIRQRTRWARGCIQAGVKTHLFRSKGLSLTQRLSYLAAVTYWYAPLKRLVYLLSPLMFSVFGITVMNCDFKQMLMFWLPMYLLAVFGIRLFSGGIRSARWSEIYELCLFPYLLPGVLAETFGIRKKDFAVTDKSGKDGWRIWYPLPFLILIVLSVWGIVNTANRIYAEQTTIYLFLMFWLIFNLYELLYALLFVLSCRKLPQQKERVNRLHRLAPGGAFRTTLTIILFRILFQTRREV